MLNQITPVILTYNEAPNIARTLARLGWAREIVIVDSFSEDQTLEIAGRAPSVRVFQRRFDCHASQWQFAIHETGITSEWVLALDADYIITNELRAELSSLRPDTETVGYRANFVYCVEGKALRGSAYPPSTVLYRGKKATYVQDGHTQRLSIDGQVLNLRSAILHDDRKSLDQWFVAQGKYARLEARKLIGSRWNELGWSDRIRKLRLVAPFAIFIYCLIAKRAILDGRPGLYYAFQRMLSELLLSLNLFAADLKEASQTRDDSVPAGSPRPAVAAARHGD